MTTLGFLLILLVLYLLWSRTIRFGLNKLSCRRSFSKPAVFVGEEAELVEVVRNDRPFVIPWLRLESRISPHIRLGRQDNLHVSGEMYYCSLFALMPYQQIRRTHHVRFTHRGAFDLGKASLTAGDMLGLTRFQRTQELSAPVLVFPALLEETRIPLPVSRMMEELSRERTLLQDPFVVRGIRAYQPGDPVRDIHWPASARMGQTQLRLREYTLKRRLMVVLNVQYEDVQWRDALPEKLEPVMEEAISLCATLCCHALRSGLSAGFGTNMNAEENGPAVLLLPADDPAHEEELLRQMALLQLRRAETFPAFLEKLTTQTDMDILILSMYDAESIRQRVAQLQSGGNQVTLHILEGGTL